MEQAFSSFFQILTQSQMSFVRTFVVNLCTFFSSLKIFGEKLTTAQRIQIIKMNVGNG